MPFFLSLLISICALSSVATAQGVATFSYQRDRISILRTSPPLLPVLPWQTTATPQHEPAIITLEVEIRSSSSLYQQEGWINLSSPQATDGVLYIFPTPEIAYLKNMPFYAPMDIAWVNPEGVITSIAPSLTLASLKQAMADDKPSRALLFVAPDSLSQRHIHPGDRLQHADFFTPPPQILRTP